MSGYWIQGSGSRDIVYVGPKEFPICLLWDYKYMSIGKGVPRNHGTFENRGSLACLTHIAQYAS